MTEPTVIILYDSAGSAHYTSSSSEFARDGLASGELSTDPPGTVEAATEPPKEEVPNGPEVPPSGDDQHPRARKRRGSVDGESAAAPADGSN